MAKLGCHDLEAVACDRGVIKSKSSLGRAEMQCVTSTDRYDGMTDSCCHSF